MCVWPLWHTYMHVQSQIHMTRVSVSFCNKFGKSGDKAKHIIKQTLFSRHNAVQSCLLTFNDAIWHRDQNRLHPVCIVRPKTELPQRQKARWKERQGAVCVFMCRCVHISFPVHLRMGLVQSYWIPSYLCVQAPYYVNCQWHHHTVAYLYIAGSYMQRNKCMWLCVYVCLCVV